MKTRLFSVAVLSMCVLLGSLSCEEEETPAYAEGAIRINATDFTPKGTLAKGDADLYGYCSRADDGFKFEIGNASWTQASTSDRYYVYLRGIEGDPVAGVTNPDAQPTSFVSGRVENVNQFAFEPDDTSDGNPCQIEIYATPGSGELTPNHRSFQYYLKMSCPNMDVQAANDDNPANKLNRLELELWFADCDA